MSQKIVASMAPDLELSAGYIVRVAALDPTTGLPVAGVKVSNTSIFVRNVGEGATGTLSSGPFMLVAGPGE